MRPPCPCGKWFPKFSKHFANETLHLQVTKVNRAESATGGGTVFTVARVFHITAGLGLLVLPPAFHLSAKMPSPSLG